METIQLTIPNMKSQHCMMTVTAAVKALGGASVKKVSSGEAEIELSGAAKDSVIAAIEKAGYTVANK